MADFVAALQCFDPAEHSKCCRQLAARCYDSKDFQTVVAQNALIFECLQELLMPVHRSPSSDEVKVAVCSALVAMTFQCEEAKEMSVKVGTVLRVLRCVMKSEDEAVIQEGCCLVGNLTASFAPNKAVVIDFGALKTLLPLITSTKHDDVTRQYACYVLANIIDEDSQQTCLDEGVLSALVELISSTTHVRTLQEACRALINLTIYNIEGSKAARNGKLTEVISKLKDADFTQESPELRSALGTFLAQIHLTDPIYSQDMATLEALSVHQ